MVGSDYGDIMDEFLDLHYDEELYRKEQPTPDDLLPLIHRNKVRLRARIVSRGCSYSRSSTHTGNSLILFRESSEGVSSVAGSIKYIFLHDQRWLLAVQRQLPCAENSSLAQCFSRYPHFPAQVYSNQLSDSLVLVELDWIMDQFLRTRISETEVVVIPVSQVCLVQLFLLFVHL
jgi:hypothetical protein